MGADAIDSARDMLANGANVIDIGPAASHPDSLPVSPEEEIHRLSPILSALESQIERVSIDSFQTKTQRYGLRRGVGFLNDIQGFADASIYSELADAKCKLIVMHSAQRGGVATRAGHLGPHDAMDEIFRFFDSRIAALTRAGVDRERLILDPGMGFFLSPNAEASLQVLSELPTLKAEFGLPLLVSVSRKSFIAATTGLPTEQLGPASIACELYAIASGANYVRTHHPAHLSSANTIWSALSQRRPLR